MTKIKALRYSQMRNITSSLNKIGCVVSEMWLKVTQGYRQCHRSMDQI